MTSLQALFANPTPDVYLMGRDVTRDQVAQTAATGRARLLVLDGERVFDRDSLYAELSALLGGTPDDATRETVIERAAALRDDPVVLLYDHAEVLVRTSPQQFRRALDVFGQVVRASAAPLVVLIRGDNISPIGDGVERLDTPTSVALTCGVVGALFVLACLAMAARVAGLL